MRISTPALEGVYQGSKWLKFQVLCDGEELGRLLEALQPFSIFRLTGVQKQETLEIPPQEFLAEYGAWIEKVKEGKIPSDAELRKILACAFTADLDALWLQELPANQFLTKIGKPVVQVQSHYFSYSKIDGVFRPMSMGAGSVFWGLQFSYPQIYQDPKTMELLEIDDSPNLELFKKIRLWVRDATRATPFIVEGNKINSPIRIGRNCLSWIHSHPQLAALQIGCGSGC